ncbi:MAG TPA: type I DNA topoisomerase, partial [Piscirickettsiaceae bacterium]|nr:type I DNA topoisomerase [Piscirickettsiaceae bacterium]
AWHLAEALGLDQASTRRIVFHEITQPAIEQAVAKPRGIDMNLVDAQQARRILDRIVGFELSPILWKKIRAGLSAGRVQSVAVRLIVEREREIEAFTPTSSFKLSGELVLLDAAGQATATVPVKLSQSFASEAEAQAFLQAAARSRFTVASVEEKPAKRSPRPPFTTSTLQQEAAAKLGFSVKQTMTLAQRLYEAGKITYMRTDSVNLSELALAQAKEVISHLFGPEYVHIRHYKSKSATAQEAHEAIRPTDLSAEVVSQDRNEQRLYTLIRQRTLASQMADARLQRTTVHIELSERPETLQAKGEVVVFPGFMQLYEVADAEETLLPPMAVGQALRLGQLQARQSFSRPPARYNEAALVRTLEELGIGRPSTYAPTIDTIQQRGYVVKEDREGVERAYRVLRVDEQGEVAAETRTEITGTEKAKLFPTDIAGVVTDFLVKHFGEIMDYHFTAHVEEELDEIAAGELAWRTMLHEFYDRFHPKVEAAEHVSREEAGQVRHLGTDPKSGKPVMVKVGRYGAYVQLGDGGEDGEEKPKFASLKPGQKMDTLTLEEALELFKLPRVLGEMPEEFRIEAADGTVFEVKQGAVLTAKRGPFGPYLEFGPKQYAPLKGYDPLSMTLEEA